MSTFKLTRYVLLIMLLLLLVGCGGGDEADGGEAPAATEAPAEPTEAPAATEAPAEPTEAPAATEAPAEPTKSAAVPTDEPPVEPARPRLGILRFGDGDAIRAANYSLQMQDVPAPTAGMHYELWLLGSDDLARNLGTLTVENGLINAEGSLDENLLAAYDRVVISLQPDGEAGSGTPDVIAFEGLVPLEALVHIRHVVVAFPGNPDGQGFVPGAEAQNLIAIEHAGLLQEALAAGDLAEARRHAEHVINILDGESGESFGDWDGDGQAQNPGDGFGVRAYLLGAQEHAGLAARANPAANEVQLHSGHVVIAADNALAWLAEAVDEAEHVISADSVDEAQPFADSLSQLTADIQAGRDTNGDGNIAPAAGEGAIATAYQHGLLMATFEFFAVAADADTTAGNPPPPPPVAPAEVFIDMLDFSFSEAVLTVPVGTTVTWVNKGEFEHSATADDGSFDTGLYGSGEQASITFNEVGTFAYFCSLHGGPGGSGMSATIIVVAESGATLPEGDEGGAEIVVDMLDFSFSEEVLTIPVGTTVTWVNKGEFEHSATADDGSFDTGLYGSGEQASITFNEVGTFPYFCSLHGGPGGSGMSATIIVVDSSAQGDSFNAKLLLLNQWLLSLI